MHHLVRALRPNRHLMRADVAELLERGEKLGDQPQAHDDTSIVGDVGQTRFDELLADEFLGVKAQQGAQRLLRLQRERLAE